MERLKQKEAPFVVLDTHAGVGLYDLDGVEARKTGEADAGILKLLVQAPRHALLQGYAAQVAACRRDGTALYPGSPRLVLESLRPQDRAILCELHPADHIALRQTLSPFGKQAGVHRRDGYEMIGASLPPPERRGLIFIDPPFEKLDEFQTAVAGMATGQGKFANGVFALWFPIKDRAAVWRFYEAVIATLEGRKVAVEFMTQPESDGLRLNGSGMLLVRPPYGVEDDLRPALEELKSLIAPKGTVRFETLADGQ